MSSQELGKLTSDWTNECTVCGKPVPINHAQLGYCDQVRVGPWLWIVGRVAHLGCEREASRAIPASLPLFWRARYHLRSMGLRLRSWRHHRGH